MPELDDDLDLDDDEYADDSDDDSNLVKRLRGELRKAQKAAKTGRDTETERDTLRRELAVYKAGLDLKPRQVAALFAAHEGDDMSPEALRATAVDLGWVEPEQDGDDEQATEAAAGHERISAAANGASPVQAGAITPGDVVQWGVDKARRFMDEHPAHWESLKRGETVTGVPFA
jgi:hypothetical protein